MNSYLEELRDVIRHLHGGEATHVESVPVKEVFEGMTVWEGIVEVFDLRGHPAAKRVYAWAHETENPERPQRHIAVLHLGPVTSAQEAVKAAIVNQYRGMDEEQA